MADGRVAAGGHFETQFIPRIKWVARQGSFLTQQRNERVTEIVDEDLLRARIDASFFMRACCSGIEKPQCSMRCLRSASGKKRVPFHRLL